MARYELGVQGTGIASLGLRFATIASTAGALAVSSLSVPTQAWAQACADLALPNPIYGTGGSALTPTLGKVATALAAADEPITILFADPGNCAAKEQFVEERVVTPFKYWDAQGSQLSCAPDAEGHAADFAYSSVAEPCPDSVWPPEVGRFLGPVNVLNIVTAIDSSETSISAEALYFIYGWGAESAAPPWTSEERLLRAPPDSFAQQMLAAHVGVPAAKFKGTLPSGSGTMLDTIVAHGATDPDSTLGFTSSSAADKSRATIKTLAYQDASQSCGYWPDSTAHSFDKLNVRSGLYTLWSPSYFFARLNAEGGIDNPRAAALIAWFQGTEEAPSGVNVTQLTSASGTIPLCAMRATREGLAGAMSSYAPESPCGCSFEATTTGVTSCEPCEVNGTVRAAEVCSAGFWESR